MDEKIILIGMPGAGKTTYLAALWYLMDMKPFETRLSLNKLEGDREYLNHIRDAWLRCKEVERTNPTAAQLSWISLDRKGKTDSIKLHIPDFSGETYRDQWETRFWSEEFVKLIKDSDGGLLFIHPNLVQARRIDEEVSLAARVESMSEHLADGPISKGQDSGVDSDRGTDEYTSERGVPNLSTVHKLSKGEHATFQEWEIAKAPTQVKLIEILQFIQQSRLVEPPFRISVIISAWDLELNTPEILAKSPTEWLSRQAPLFSQFLDSNKEYYPHRVYGVSAQGGDYSDRDSLASVANPEKRIIIEGPDCTDYDLTVPLDWIWENNEA